MSGECDDCAQHCLECICDENQECYFSRLNRLEDKQYYTIQTMERLTDVLERLIEFLDKKF